MKSIPEIDVIEEGYVRDQKPVLSQSFRLLLERWAGGTRDRETALRLVFLGWFSTAEANWLTGLDDPPAEALFQELAAYLNAETTNDDEVLFVFYVMNAVAPECFGAFRANADYWASLGEQAGVRLGDRRFTIDPAIFCGRGAYGEYFARQARGHAASRAARQAQTKGLDA